jgi:murein DD-endopeptidase MepM/ murein hydrolase activator NlpD
VTAGRGGGLAAIAFAAVAAIAAVALALPALGSGASEREAPGAARSAVPGALVAAAAAAPSFQVVGGKVSPRRAYFAGRPVRIAFAIEAATALTLQVDVVREATRNPVRRFELAAVAPGIGQNLEWDGLTGGGDVAPNGSYRVRVRAPDGTARNAGRLTLHGHIFPIRGRHADRGPIGAFGVGRSGGRTHEGFDVNAACGTPLVAARGGTVVRADYDPVLYGNVVIIRGERTRRDYWYAHLKHAARVHVGDHVRTGQRIGSVGATGNARTIGCHLHFEIHSRGKPIDPAPELHAWDGWS